MTRGPASGTKGAIRQPKGNLFHSLFSILNNIKGNIIQGPHKCISKGPFPFSESFRPNTSPRASFNQNPKLFSIPRSQKLSFSLSPSIDHTVQFCFSPNKQEKKNLYSLGEDKKGKIEQASKGFSLASRELCGGGKAVNATLR